MQAESWKLQTPRRPWKLLLLWVFILGLALSGLAAMQRSAQLGELERESAELLRIASQRAGQHYAHLTALSAIAVASGGQRPDLFLEVAAAISRFYPRITGMQLVPLDPAQEITGTAPLAAGAAGAIRTAAHSSSGLPVLLLHPSRAQHYLLVKRSPNSDQAVYALALAIDAAQLLDSESAFWSLGNTEVRLLLPRGELLAGVPGLNHPQFGQPLESISQPLRLEAAMHFGLRDLLPPGQAALAVLLVSLAYAAGLVALRQRSRVRAAEREAGVRRMEVQLTHAARVNAMGEMASGMAHELTQPLTAILAQAQAGQRLAAQGGSEVLRPVLHDIGVEAKRASAILERLRNWSRPQRGAPADFDLRDAMRNVETLLAAEAQRMGAVLRFSFPEKAIMLRADQVEIEQVLHNIIRNGLEAVEKKTDGKVFVRSSISGGSVSVDVSDNGPGVDEGLLPRLFTPFATTRENGTGLGLVLS
ncbi:MAG: sensor histidine kinase [Leisingera sp.]